MKGLLELIYICCDYAHAHAHEMFLNVNKTVDVVFPSEEIKLYPTSIFLSGT